jgi:CRISPR-associated protein Cas2
MTGDVVCYDISDPKRLRKVYRLMRGFGDRIQLSVFWCQLSPAEKVTMKAALEDVLNHDHDSAFIICLGPPDGLHATSLETIGRPIAQPPRHAVVL